MSPSLLVLGVCVIVILGIIFSAWMVHSQVKIPHRCRLKPLTSEELEPSLVSLLSQLDKDLEKLGFEKINDFEVEGLVGENLHRLFLKPEEATLAMVSIISRGLRKIPHLEFYNRFQDQSSLSTDQAVLPHYFETPPERLLQRFSVLKPNKLYQFHQEKFKSLLAKDKKPVRITKDNVLAILEQDQQELLDYQIKQGFFSLVPEKGLLQPTWKFAFYFIIRNFDPIPSGLSLGRFISTLIICAGIMYSFFAFARWGNLEKLSNLFSLSLAESHYLLCSVGVLLSSILLGFIIQRRGFLWAGIIAGLGLLIFLHKVFPDSWILILVSAQAGLVGNQLYESRITGLGSRLFSQFLILGVLLVIGWMMLGQR